MLSFLLVTRYGRFLSLMMIIVIFLFLVLSANIVFCFNFEARFICRPALYLGLARGAIIPPGTSPDTIPPRYSLQSEVHSRNVVWNAKRSQDKK